MTAPPRPEHPRPQFERDRWLDLDGPRGVGVLLDLERLRAAQDRPAGIELPTRR